MATMGPFIVIEHHGHTTTIDSSMKLLVYFPSPNGNIGSLMMRWVKYFPSLEDRVDLKLQHTGAYGGPSDEL
ncbi:hypothetical protein N7488_010688 [Penicillium malachiteum]|nr:hypothetical protein N7488_010688 [Penicillium malachiteum]